MEYLTNTFHMIMAMLAFGSMIFIHELGHFLAAKKVGCRVEKFYVGFDFWGLKLFKYVHKGTEYGIGVFPLGGYVKIAGQEDMGKAKVDGKPDEFTSKSIPQRILILIGGVVFNFISAFFFCALALWCGYVLTKPQIGIVEFGSPAWEAGLKPGDEVLRYNNIPVNTFDDIIEEATLAGTKPTTIKIRREGVDEPMVLPIQAKIRSDEYGEKLNMLDMGIFKPMYGVQYAFGAAEEAGLQARDVLVEINGQPINNHFQISHYVKHYGEKGESLKVKVKRDGEIIPLEINPRVLNRYESGLSFKTLFKIESILDQNEEIKALGLEVGDHILSLGKYDLTQTYGLEIDEEYVFENLKILRNNQEKVITYKSSVSDFNAFVFYKSHQKDVIITDVKKGSPAERSGFQKGDKLTYYYFKKSGTKWDEELTYSEVSIDFKGKPGVEASLINVLSLNQYDEKHDQKIPEVKCFVEREGKEIQLDLQLELLGQKRYMMGIAFGDVPIDHVSAETVLKWPFFMLRKTYRVFAGLFTGKISIKSLSGPPAMFKMLNKASQRFGLSYLFFLMAVISINLAFMNILPIPILDGGHILFCLIEAVRGKPLNERLMLRIQYAGLFMMLSLFVFVISNDIRVWHLI